MNEKDPRRSATVMAVDIGGTKMAVGVVDRAGRLLWSTRALTPAAGLDPFPVLESLVEGMPGKFSPVACGVGIGGPMTAGGALVSPLNIPAWRDFPLLAHLGRQTGLRTWVDNDAKALALGEGWVGAAVGRSGYLSMVVSTGIGGGIVLDGRLLDGGTGNAGHVGHLVVEPDGRPCVCGSRGCLEAEASGLSIAAVTGRPAADADTGVRERTGRLVGRGVADVCNLLDLPLAIVAGSVALGFGAPFFAAAQAEIDLRCRLSFSKGATIVPSALGSDGPLIGAAATAGRALGWLTESQGRSV